MNPPSTSSRAWVLSSLLLILALAAPLRAQVPQLLNYQGRVVVGTTAFTGTGQFKFALVSTTGSTTYWSNDGTSTAGAQPTAAVSLPVAGGLYSLLLGDTALTNMTAIPATVFANSDVRLRVWFNDGTNGFQLLTPDQRIASVGYAVMAGNVPDGAITTAKLATGAVTATNIASGSITGAKLAAAAITSANIANGAIGSAQLANGAVTSAQLGAGAVTAGSIANGSITGTQLAAATVTSANMAAGSIGSTQLAGGSVNAFHLASGAVTSAQLATDAVIGTSIANATVTGAKIAPATITAANIAVGAIGTAQLATGAVGSNQLAPGAVTGSNIANGSITAANIVGGSIGSSLIANGAVNTTHLAFGAVTGVNIAGGTITSTNIATGAINSGLLANGAVNTAQLAPGAVMGANIATGTITGAQLADGAVSTASLAPNAVITTRLADGAVTMDKLADSAVTSAKIATGAVGPFQLSPGAAAANLGAGGQSGVPSGGIVLSVNPADPNLAAAGYVKLGKAALYDAWDQRADMPAAGDGSPRSGHSAVWTGSEMIIWGGKTNTTVRNDGDRYNPTSNTWIPVNGSGAPSARWNHTAVWTGAVMIIWGGDSLSTGYSSLGTGAKYDPALNHWSPMVTPGPVISPRSLHTAVWTGSQMIVWGGLSSGTYSNSGAYYDPGANTWVSLYSGNEPVGCLGHTAVWTGTEMIVWGGKAPDTSLSNRGGRYDPRAGWRAAGLNSFGAPAAREYHTAVWTGSVMIVWGGDAGNDSSTLATGSCYDPGQDSWTSVTTNGAPAPRNGHTAVWTGSQMIVWGGYNGNVMGNGGCYNPVSDSWINTASVYNPPAPRRRHTAVWDGAEMLVTGGTDQITDFPDTWAYAAGRSVYLYQRP